jgi:hypothetical protein
MSSTRSSSRAPTPGDSVRPVVEANDGLRPLGLGRKARASHARLAALNAEEEASGGILLADPLAVHPWAPLDCSNQICSGQILSRGNPSHLVFVWCWPRTTR